MGGGGLVTGICTLFSLQLIINISMVSLHDLSWSTHPHACHASELFCSGVCGQTQAFGAEGGSGSEGGGGAGCLRHETPTLFICTFQHKWHKLQKRRKNSSQISHK